MHSLWRTPFSVVPIHRTVHHKNESLTNGNSLYRKIQMCSCVKCTRVSGNFSLMISISLSISPTYMWILIHEIALHVVRQLSDTRLRRIHAWDLLTKWAAPSEFGTYRLCEQRRFRRACASAQSRQNLRCSLIQAVNQEEPSDRKPDPWLLWMAGHAQLKLVMTECSKIQIRLTGPKCPLRLLYSWHGIFPPD